MSTLVSGRAFVLPWIGTVALACAPALAWAQSYSYRQVPGNGRGLFELRLGGTYVAPSGGSAGAGLLVGAVTSGPTSGTTSLIAGVLDLNKLFDPVQPLPGFTTVVPTGSVFSLGGGCLRGGQTDFPYINGNRPAIVRYGGAGFIVVVPTLTGISPTNQYDSADCAVDRNATRTVYAFSNRSLNRVELWQDGAGGFQPLQLTQLAGVATPFGGGLRPALDIDVATQQVSVLYQELGGRTVLNSVNPLTGTVGGACEVFTAPAPTGFTRPRETTTFSFSGGTRFAVGDFDNNGTTEIVRVSPGCVRQSFPAGSSAGGNGFNWTGYGHAPDPTLNKENVLWGDYYTLDDNTNFVPQLATGPFPGRGGPFASCDVRTADGDQDVITATVGVPSVFAEVGLGKAENDRISILGNEDREFVKSCLRSSLSF